MSEKPVDRLVGCWESTSTHNMDKLYNAMEVPELDRNLACDWRSEVKLHKIMPGIWKIASSFGDKRRITVFPLDQFVETLDLMERRVKSCLRETHTDLLEHVKSTPGDDIFISRTLTDDGNLKTIIKTRGVVGEVNFRRMSSCY